MRVDANKPTRAADPFLGQVLGGCRIDEVLGRGGMGVVYKATQLSLNRPVAIKVLPEEVCGQPQFVERFRREVDVLSRLSHPNVVTVFERGEIDARLYVVMEYVHGTSLREVMRKGPLPSAEALVIVRGVLAALEHAHEKGIIHRDIKPENVLVAPGGIVKVADFGLSRLLDAGAATRLTHTNLLLGTFEYMAPEQRERAKEADERADIYATGVVLYEMLAGELPIGHFAALSRKRPKECDSRIDEIVEKSLAKSPADRYQRASEMGAAVSRVLSVTMLPPAAPPVEAPRQEPSRVHVAARLTVEEESRSGSRQRKRKGKSDDPAQGVGCVVFLIILVLGRGLVTAILAAVVAVVVVRALARSSSVLRAVIGLLAAAAVVGALLLFTGARAPSEPDWLGRPGVTAVETRGDMVYASLPLGSATGPMPDLEHGFLGDGDRVAWIRLAWPTKPGPSHPWWVPGKIELRVVEGSVVASVRAPKGDEEFGTAALQAFGGVLAHALSCAYRDTFVREPSLPEFKNPLDWEPPGPATAIEEGGADR